jgi:putative MATE family efflux protein
MRLLWLSNILNLILDPVLIFGLGPFPKLGVTGAALATFSGRGIAVLYQFYRLSKGTDRLRILGRHMRLQAKVLWQLVRLSLAAILQFLIGQASWLALVRIISLFGPSAIAGYTIAIRIVIFAVLPAWGLSNAAATLVGQNLGAGHPERARSAVWRTGMWNVIFLGSVGVVFIAFAPWIIGLFTHDPDVSAIAIGSLRIFSCGNMAYAYGMVLLQAFNGAGDTLTPTLVNLFGFWIVEIPLAWFLAMHTSLHINGVFVSVVIAQSVIVLISLFLFARGRWASHRV